MADKNIIKQKQALRRRRRVRNMISGTAERPRMTVAKSLKNIFVQIIDDARGVTLVGLASNSSTFEAAKGNKLAIAKQVGIKMAELAKSKGIETIVFDRNRHRFHGRIKAVADGAREGGLKF